ncbi:MAG TPA: hypothetical protein VNA28_13745 [Solirubrobacteraceae bacterium]|nr:hypothetical protein [Solirubrobacteraceae bacterium]
MAIAGIALLAGCAGDEQAPSPPRSATVTQTTASAVVRPALCEGALRVRVTGRVSSRTASELSGLVLSRSRPGVLWAHNDSGDSPRLLAVGTSGAPVAEVALSGAVNVDWEDIAAGPDGTLLVGDIGDNLGRRPSVVVYRVPEPRASGTVAVGARHELRYPDGARDAEALLFDRSNGAIVIVTKSFGGEARVYAARRPSSRQVTMLRRSGTIQLGLAEPVTAGDVSADGRTIALRTYDSAFVWRRRAGETITAALRRRPCRADADLAGEGQGEALALNRNGLAFFTVPEGPRPPLRRYETSGAVS